jgi:hypothetical protein
MAEISHRLQAYLSMERVMLQLDAAGDGLAESLREAMDALWADLSDGDREFLNRRHLFPTESHLERGDRH